MQYLTASIEQRRELLAGLLDTDGTIDKRTGRIEFCNTNKTIAVAALELARSLGYKATINEGRATLYGVDKGAVYKVGWTTTDSCFRLARKAAIQAAWVERRRAQGAALVATRANRVQRNCWDNKVITAWRKVETVPVRCIAVAAEHHTYVATDQYIVTHNTTQLRYRLIFEMGKDPNVAIAYLSATQSHPRKQLRAIKDEIETNHRIHQVFPRLKKAQGEIEVWNQTEILIDREGSRPDVTVQCFGLYGNILGSRKNILVFDDICNYLNTLTEASREKMHEWVNEALSRLKGKVKVWAIGHIWHERDLLQRLAEQPGFAYARYEATTPDPANPDGPHILNFPRVLPQREINRLLDQINSPVFQEMMLWNRLPDRTASRFRDLWFETCLRRGSGYSMVPTWDAARSHTRVVCGVDLGHRKKIGSDLTVMITAAVYADGSRRLLDMRAGNWTGSEIMENLEDVHDRFGAHIWVEDNGAQNLLLELGEKYTAVPLYAHNTNRYNKGDLANGVEAVGRQMKQGKWVFPCNEALIDAIVPGAMTVPRMREILGEDDLASRHLLRLIMDCKSYDPEKHTGDYLMAFWILSEGIRKMAAGEVTPVGDFMAR
jgi:hypothetical protein